MTDEDDPNLTPIESLGYHGPKARDHMDIHDSRLLSQQLAMVKNQSQASALQLSQLVGNQQNAYMGQQGFGSGHLFPPAAPIGLICIVNGSSYIMTSQGWMSNAYIGTTTNGTPQAFPTCAPVQELTPDPDVPNTLGWRCWYWSPAYKRLASPSQGTIWHEPELHAYNWDECENVRMVAGIHAKLVPLDWTKASCPEVPQVCDWVGAAPGRTVEVPIITGIIERFGKYVLGTEGWRAEWCVIKTLYAPTADLAEELRNAYPDVEILEPIKETQP